MKQKSIEEKYKAMSEIQHIISRSGMYVGSSAIESKQLFVYNSDDGKMNMKDISYSPAMFKLFDEIISNSCDEYRRNDNMGINEIIVTINKSLGSISIKDNGGIPVVKHKTAGMYVPEFIFGQLRTSSNYNDDEDRAGIGLNGLGSVLTNIFSKEFNVITCDNKNLIEIKWINHMSKKEIISLEKKKEHFTEIKYYVDFSLFDGYNSSEYTDDFITLVEKRCIDAAASNIGLQVKFIYFDGKKKIRESKWKFKKFEDYMELYDDFFDKENLISYKDDKKQIWVCPGSSIDVAFVNGAECSLGTHIKAVRSFINNSVNEVLKKKHKIEVTNKGIDSKYSIFGVFDISNPIYSNQTKNELSTLVENFYKDKSQFTVPDNFLNKINKSEIIDLVLDWYKKKSEAEDAAKIRKLNREAKKLLRSDKFINCNSKRREEKQLWIYEGDSAASGHRGARDPMTQAGYLMRGVPKNVIESSPTEVMKNQVFNDIVNIIGLQWGEYNKAENLKFGKLIIASDADPDGDKIACLLMVFFNHFPELFEQGLVYRCNSPIIVAKDKKGKSYQFYSFDEWNKTDQKKFVSIKHVKGLGTQNIAETKQMMRDPHLMQITKDKMADMMLNKWFGKGIAKERKDMLREDVEAC